MSNKRLREIVSVFTSVGLTTLREKNKPIDEKLAPAKLRMAFEQLGPSFVKIGQILSTRSDLLPDAYIRELAKLQSNVPPMPQEEVMEAIKAELSLPLDQVFASISEQPLASASVAQTHRAILVTGQEVIVKIQRPHLSEILEEDLAVLMRLVRRVPKSFLPMVDLVEVLTNLKVSLTEEIDFCNEAQAMLTFTDINRAIKCIGVPKVYQEFTTEHMLVEEFIDGIPINHYSQLIESGYDLEDIGKKLMLSFIKQVFKDGYFHGDPHPGNLLIHEGKIYFIDFGIVGQLENGMRAALNDILYGFTAQDVDGMTNSILSITSTTNDTSRLDLTKDVEQMLTKYGSLDLGNLSITDLLEDLVAIFHRNQLKAPAQMTILEKSALQIEGIFRELAPDVDLMTLAKNYFLENMGPDMLKQALNKETLLIELFYLLKNGKNVPRRLNQLLEQILNGRILVTHDLYDYNNRIKLVNSITNRLIISILFLALILGGSLLSQNAAFETVSKLFFSLAGVLFILEMVLIVKNRK